MLKSLFFFIAFILLFASCSDRSELSGSDPVSSDSSVGSNAVGGAGIDLGGTRQVIRGYGGASVWLGALSDSQMNTLFGNGNANQLGFSVLRIRIAPDGNWSNELSNAQKAKARGAIVMATPWTPPASMKTNNSTIQGSLKTTEYANYAKYLQSFVNYMASGGASLYAISLQNEPDWDPDYEGCTWTASNFLTFCKNNAGAISTKVIMPESLKFNHALSDATLNDATAAANIDIIGGHLYGGGLTDYPLARNKGKELWMTEHLVNNTDWAGALATGKEIHDCMTVGNFSAYIWWYLKRSYGPMDDNNNPTKRGFVMAQYSKYVRPGYNRVNATYNPSTNVYVSAYKGSGKVVIIALNMGSSAVSQPFTIGGGSVSASFTPHITSSSKNVSTESSVNLSGGAFTYSLPAQSITTFVSN